MLLFASFILCAREESGVLVTGPRVAPATPAPATCIAGHKPKTLSFIGVVTEHSVRGTGKLKSCFNSLFYVIFPCDGWMRDVVAEPRVCVEEGFPSPTLL